MRSGLAPAGGQSRMTAQNSNKLFRIRPWTRSTGSYKQHRQGSRPPGAERDAKNHQSGSNRMATHKFEVGQTVFLQPTILNRIVERRAYEVTKQLPVEGDGRVRYRIKNPTEPFERVANEGELSVD